MQNKNLNTMKTFDNGFQIERNGEIITLTPEEMSDFKYLELARVGRLVLESYFEYSANDEEKKILKTIMEDEEICHNVEEDILNEVLEDIDCIERVVVDDYISMNKKDNYES